MKKLITLIFFLLIVANHCNPPTILQLKQKYNLPRIPTSASCRINIVATDELYTKVEASRLVEALLSHLGLFRLVHLNPQLEADYELQVRLVDGAANIMPTYFTLVRLRDETEVITNLEVDGDSAQDIITMDTQAISKLFSRYAHFYQEDKLYFQQLARQEAVERTGRDQRDQISQDQSQSTNQGIDQASIQGTADEVTSIRFIPSRHIYGLVIGVGDYQDSSFPDLPFAINDAEGIYEMLLDDEFIGVPQENIFLITGEEATLTNIYVKLDEIKRKATASTDLIFFYYSGHGAPLTDGSGEIKDGLLVPFDANINSLERTCIPLSELQTEIQSLPASAIVMLDTCFSGQGRSEGVLPPGIRGLTVEPRQDLIQINDSNKLFITGSKANQFSNDYPEKQHGLFTYYVLQGLHDKRADTNFDGFVEMGELYNYLEITLPRESTALSGLQEPQLFGEGKSLVINQ